MKSVKSGRLTDRESPFAALKFCNRLTERLPCDPETGPRVRPVNGAAYSLVNPTPSTTPTLLAFSPELIETLGMPKGSEDHPDFLAILAGQRLLENMKPHATCYGGHQFGYWAGQLGDGRAINLGECKTPSGDYQTLQLKGAGKTPYSRNADGRAVLRSSLREFLCSEAMHHLGIPTTRALALLTTGEPVLRDLLYDGHPRLEPGAIVCRVAPSFTRFGHFELPAARGDLPLLKAWVDYTLTTDFSSFAFEPGKEGYAAWFCEVAKRTARLIAEWQRVGFVHGVMNTDNLSILGLTIDYGPYGWLDHYDPHWTPNITDASGRRYAFGQQADIARWNLIRLAHALYPLIEDTTPLEQGIEAYDRTFEFEWRHLLGQKLGLCLEKNGTDERFSRTLFQILEARETDYTLFFRGLSEWSWDAHPVMPGETPPFILAAWYGRETCHPTLARTLHDWLIDYQSRAMRDPRPPEERRRVMLKANPKYLFRNYLAQTAIERMEAGDSRAFLQLFEVLKHPYDEQQGAEPFAERRPDWARDKPGCSMLSCSS